MAWIDALLRKTVELGGSDLHLTAGTEPRLRLHGEITPLPDVGDLAATDLHRVLQEITPKPIWEEFQREHDADFAYSLEGVGRFRVNLFLDRTGPGAVLRQIPEEIPTAEQLGLPPAALELTTHSKGLVLVTGPTGSGKSTTLAAMIDHINRTRAEHIVTIEDPIEFVHPNRKCLVNQREVSRHTASFKRALRAALREDPDVVLVGEMRDLETISIALETAETGHLVFGTLHTNTAPSTVHRIIDQFPADRQAQVRAMLAGSLRGVIAQTLLRKVGGGRIAAHEILVCNSAVSALIREGKTHQLLSAMQVGAREGMCLLNDSLQRLVEQGLVEAEEALRKSVDREDLRKRLEGAGRIASAPAPSAPSPRSEPAPRPEPAAVGDGTRDEGEGYVDPFEEFRRRRKS